jgi:hypothetical protein
MNVTSPSQFALRSALVRILNKIFLLFNSFVVSSLLIMADSRKRPTISDRATKMAL